MQIYTYIIYTHVKCTNIYLFCKFSFYREPELILPYFAEWVSVSPDRSNSNGRSHKGQVAITRRHTGRKTRETTTYVSGCCSLRLNSERSARLQGARNQFWLEPTLTNQGKAQLWEPRQRPSKSCFKGSILSMYALQHRNSVTVWKTMPGM